MFSLSQAFHRARRQRNRVPVIIFSLRNAHGLRVFSDRAPSDRSAGILSSTLAGGLFLADGQRLAGLGSQAILERGARVLSFGRLRESLAAQGGQRWASLQQEEAGSLTVELSNAGPPGGKPFSRMEALEGLLGAVGELTLGYPEVEPREWLIRFRGQVHTYSLEAERVSLGLRAL